MQTEAQRNDESVGPKLFQQFNVNLYFYLIANYTRQIGHCKVSTIDFGGRGSSHALAGTHRIFDWSAWASYIQRDLLGNAMNGQIACNRQLTSCSGSNAL